MKIRLHPNAKDRLRERGVTEEEVIATVERGERFVAQCGRKGFRCHFPFDSEWHFKRYSTKQVEAYAIKEEGWLVITVIVKFF